MLEDFGRQTLTQLRSARLYVRLRPFDTATEVGRATERHRRVALTALAAAVSRGIKVATALVTVPLTLGYLGAERYGLWMTISSVVAILAFADLGMGNGLLNAVSEAHGRENREMAREYVSSTFFMLLGVAAFLGILAAASYPWISWSRAFNVSSPEAAAEAGPAVAAFFACFLVSMPLGVVQRVQLGYQEGFANSVWEAVGSLLGLAAVLVAIAAKAGLPWLVLAMAGGPVLALLANAVVLFGYRRPWLRPAFRRAELGAAMRVLRVGALFFVLQAAGAAAFLSDNLVAAHVLGAAAVTQYAVPAKLFDVLAIVTGLVLSPLWPAYGESIARGDIRWVRRTLKRSLVAVALFTGVAASLLAVAGAPIVRAWTGAAVHPTPLLLAGLAVWAVLSNTGTTLAMFLNGANVVRAQVVCAVFMGLAALTLKLVLAPRIGLPGIVWGTVAAYTLCTLIPLAACLPSILRSLERGRARPFGA
jgi:O-antigen/teichoic acid export membrane protein